MNRRAADRIIGKRDSLCKRPSSSPVVSTARTRRFCAHVRSFLQARHHGRGCMPPQTRGRTLVTGPCETPRSTFHLLALSTGSPGQRTVGPSLTWCACANDVHTRDTLRHRAVYQRGRHGPCSAAIQPAANPVTSPLGCVQASGATSVALTRGSPVGLSTWRAIRSSLRLELIFSA